MDSPIEKVSSSRITFAIIFASITFFLLGGLFGRHLGELDAFLPPEEYNEIISAGRNQNASISKIDPTQVNKNSNTNSNDITQNSSWLDNCKRV